MMSLQFLNQGFFMVKPIILTSLSKAGGVGKTTMAVNLAYEWSLRGLSVGIIDLDQNHSIEEFVGLTPQEDPTLTSLAIFEPEFEGDYAFIPVLGSDKIALLQGHSDIEDLAESLYRRKRREYILRKVMQKHPLNFDLVILDLPGGFDLITENALSVSTHLLIPVHIGVKTLSVASLIERIVQSFEDLELSPPPKIVGLLPNQLDKSSSSDNMVYKALQEIAAEMNLKLYPAIRHWLNIKRAAIDGKSLKQLRSNDPMSEIFSLVVDDLVQSTEE